MADCDGCIHIGTGLSVRTGELSDKKCLRNPPQIVMYDDGPGQLFPDAVTRCGEYVDNRPAQLKQKDY